MLDKKESAYLYIVFGQSEIHYFEAIFSILTLLHHTKQPVIVLCEQPKHFQFSDRIDTVLLTEALKNEWLQGSDYFFNIKLYGTYHILSHYTDKVIFLDTDTVINENIDNLFNRIDNNNAILHDMEGAISKRRFRKDLSMLFGQSLPCGQQDIELLPESKMYNSGVIGINKANASVLIDAANLASQIDKKATCHTSEQLALGLCLERKVSVHTLGNKPIYHYWHKKRKYFIRESIVQVLSSTAPEQLLTQPQLLTQVKTKRSFLRFINDKLSNTRKHLTNDIQTYKQTNADKTK